jgi:hypothetical protein
MQLFSLTSQNFQRFCIQGQDSSSLQRMAKPITALQETKKSLTFFDSQKISKKQDLCHERVQESRAILLKERDASSSDRFK